MMEYSWLDLLLIPISFIYIFTIIGIATKLKRENRISGITARKIVHIGVGILVIAIPILFSTYLIPFLVGCTFIVVTILTCPISPIPKLRFEAFKDGNGLGTVYYAISLTTLIFLYFDEPWLIEVGFLPLVIGDAMANLGGIRYGSHKWFFMKNKSVEGSLSGFFSTLIVLVIVLWVYSLLDLFLLNVFQMILLSLVIAFSTMIVELFSPYGLDNLTIPLIAVIIALQF